MPKTPSQRSPPRIIIGIDPGIAITGHAFVRELRGVLTLLVCDMAFTVRKECLTMTTITHHSSNQVTELQQLVLFLELLGVTSVPLDQNKQEQVLVKELEEPRFSLKDALAAGQMTLW